MTTYLSDFQLIRPKFETCQDLGMIWLSEAHLESEKSHHPDVDKKQFLEVISRLLAKVGCKKEKISKRGHVLDDFLHRRWDEMKIYNMQSDPHGVGLKERSRFFLQYTEDIFDQFYSTIQEAPDDLIHVTCTGYSSPSAAQKLVAKKGWEKITAVTHAYHMGCLAAMPAIRIGSGFCRSGKKIAHIVHTEICSLHMNLAIHTPEQLVGQSLFADGFIKYSVTQSRPEVPCFEVLALHEEIIPNSEALMRWECEDWGFFFTLSKQIPTLIAESIQGFLERLIQKTSISYTEILKKAHFAIHPGGPKIIEQIRTCLNLSCEQVTVSEKILYEYGNMSSATIPHVLDCYLQDNALQADEIVIGLAFGPGLSMSGIVLKK